MTMNSEVAGRASALVEALNKAKGRHDRAEAMRALFYFIADLSGERDALASALQWVRDDYDCDGDAHKYGTCCRRCLAAQALEGKELEVTQIMRRERDWYT